MTPAKQRYPELADSCTCAEIAETIGITQSSVRRYAHEFGIRPKPGKFTNIPEEQWVERFNEAYAGRLELVTEPAKSKNGHLKAKCRCLRCRKEWTICIQEKIRTMTGCNYCDKGNHGNRYDQSEAETMLNKHYTGQWRIVHYGHYSEKDSVIKCTLCGTEQTVKLADMIATTTCRCTVCQTGSFGEYVIATTLAANCIPFEREKRIDVGKNRYRLDFMIDSHIGLEYSGAQHFEPGLYHKESINEGVEKKRAWCIKNGYEFYELRAVYDVPEIVQMLSNVLQRDLSIPSPDDFRRTNPDMVTVLCYMKSHSARQTNKDLHVSIAKIRKYVKLDGYPSIAAWQAANKV